MDEDTDKREQAQPRDDYTCSQCHATGVRLFRVSQEFIRKDSLWCASCLERAGVERIGERFRWQVPAVPILDSPGAFWGYGAVPHARALWWRQLPESRDPEVTL